MSSPADNFTLWFQRLDRKLDQILAKENTMAADLTALTAAVQAETTADGSIVTLLNGIAAQLLAAQADPVAIAALAAQLQTNAATVAAAVLANTPVGPQNVPPPLPGPTPAPQVKKKP